MKGVIVTIDDVFTAIEKHPYPIRAMKPVMSPIDGRHVGCGALKFIPGKYVELDMREYARKAYETFCSERKEQEERYWKLRQEFDEYKRASREYEQFLRFKSEQKD